MSQISPDSVPRPPATRAGPFACTRFAQYLAEAGLFCFGALVICMPGGLLPFAVLLLITSAIGYRLLKCSAAAMGGELRTLLWLTLLVLVMALLWIAKFEHELRDVGNRSRFLVLPWAALWVYALCPRKIWLWRGAVAGIFGALVLASIQVLAGQSRAEGWTNAIVLADMVLVLLVLVMFCRPQHSWRLPLLALLAACVIIVLSGSRGVWLGLAAVVLTLSSCMRWGSARARVLLLGAASVVAAAMLFTVPALTEQVRLDELQHDVRRLEVGDSNSSAGARIERLQVAWDTFLEHPWTGVGVGRFDDAMKRLPICQGAWQQRCHLGHAHNDLAEWGATQGVPGVLLLLAVYGVPMLLFVRLHRDSGRTSLRGPAAAGIMVVFVYILCGLTQSMFAHQVTASFYVAIVGILIGLARRENDERKIKSTLVLTPNL